MKDTQDKNKNLKIIFYSFVTLVAIATIIRIFVFEIISVQDKYYVVNKLVSSYKRLELVYHDRGISRIIALPHESIEIFNNKIFVNGKNIIVKEQSFDPAHFTELDYKIRKLKKDQFFLMADDRNYSIDSRNYGPINKSKIIGKILFMF